MPVTGERFRTWFSKPRRQHRHLLATMLNALRVDFNQDSAKALSNDLSDRSVPVEARRLRESVPVRQTVQGAEHR